MPKGKRGSTFSAFPTNEQRISNINTDTKVNFQFELFDVNNEYDPVTSTFTARQSGIYLFNAGINFAPDGLDPYRLFISIRLNDLFFGGFDSEEFRGGASGVLDVSRFLQLQAGDRVEIFARSTVPGRLLVPSTFFEGTRLE